MKKKTKLEKFYVDNPVNIEEPQIKECLLKLKIDEDIAENSAKRYHGLIKRIVPNKFQSVLDYYLERQEILECEIGDKIKDVLLFHFSRFFDALITVALQDLEDDGII